MLEQLSPVAAIAVGCLLLLAGRRVFWLALGTVGFMAAMILALRFLQVDSQAVLFGLALVAGVAGALLALFVQRLAVSIAGFLAGGWLGMTLWTQLFGGEGLAPLLAFPVAGLVVAAFATRLFELALVAVSALVGALLIVEASGLDAPLSSVLLAVLTVAGCLVQWSFGRRRDD